MNYAQRNANKNTHIVPVNSSAEFFRAIRTKIERSTVRGIVKEWEKGAFEGVEAETGGGEKVSTKIQLK